MRDFPGTSRPASSGLLATLRSWLQAWSGGGQPPSSRPARETAVPMEHFYGSARVLVVDDNPVNLMLMSTLLEGRGLLPWLAADGAEAVELACELDFDLILMDLQMPVLDGFSATSAIREFEQGNSLPTTPVLAYSSTVPAPELLAAHGLQGRLCKPCSAHDLEECLVRWCPTYRPAPRGPDTGASQRPAGPEAGHAGHRGAPQR